MTYSIAPKAPGKLDKHVTQRQQSGESIINHPGHSKYWSIHPLTPCPPYTSCLSTTTIIPNPRQAHCTAGRLLPFIGQIVLQQPRVTTYLQSQEPIHHPLASSPLQGVISTFHTRISPHTALFLCCVIWRLEWGEERMRGRARKFVSRM